MGKKGRGRRARLCTNAPARIIVFLYAAAAVLLLTACDRHEARSEPSESAKVIGVTPAPPSDSPGPHTEIDKTVEVTAMPLPGQADDPETVALLNSQRSEAIGVLKDPDLARIANSDAALETWRQRTLKGLQRKELQRKK